MRILLLEDEDDLLDAYRALLGPKYEIQGVHTANHDFHMSQMVRWVSASDLVISDAGMAHARLTVIHQLCQKLGRPLFVVTGRLKTELPFQPEHFLLKPFDPAIFRQMVRNILSKSA